MDYARMLLPAAMRKKDDSFTIDLAITAANLQFGVTPYWNAGGWCNIDWGDGTTQAATTSGTALTHTYAEAGSYRVKVRGNMYRFRVGSTNPEAVIDCNFNWEALGELTSLNGAFWGCSYVQATLTRLPDRLEDGYGAFYGCQQMICAAIVLPSTLRDASMLFLNCGAITIDNVVIPEGVTNITYIFQGCDNAPLRVRSLPESLSSATSFKNVFYLTYCSYLDIDEIAASAPTNGWAGVNDITNMFSRAGSSTNGCTGHIATFMRALPAVTTVTTAFQSTNTTTFGDNDYFEITLTTTEANQSWGFTATSSAGRWYCFDWGDGTAVTSNKNLDVFTSGTKVSHTFATPGTYHIKLATAPCTIVFDAYDSDNGNWAALGQ